MTAETQVNPQTLAIGHVIEDYRITAVLGQGGFGITYKARDETLRRDVAIKEYLPQQFAIRDGTGTVRPRSDDDRDLFEWGLTRFVDEGRALAMFRHPNIASVIRFLQQNGTAYLVMEFEEGMDLEHWLADRDRPDEERLVQGILAPVLDGLARVHDKGLLHRDIKPENIFIRRDGTPVLIDFGASRPHGPEAASRLTSIISAGYSPFEQYGDGERQGPWSDLYALAGTVYRVISGHPPVDAIARQQGTPLEPAVKVGAGAYSKRLLETLDRALSLDVAERPQDAREFLTRLGLKPPAPPVDPEATMVRLGGAPPAAAPGRRAGRLLAMGLVVAAITAAGAYLVLLGPDSGLPGAGDAAGPASAGPEPAAQEPVREEAQPAPDDATPAPDDSTPAQGEVAGEEGEAPSESGAESVADGEDIVADGGGSGDAEAEAPAPDPADALSEDRILAGLDVPAEFVDFRNDQLAGSMLQYTTIKGRFDACNASACSSLPALLAELRQAQETQRWSRHGVDFSIQIQKPKRLDNEDCPYLLDIRETVSVAGESRHQVRTYCTSDGFDRQLQSVETVT